MASRTVETPLPILPPGYVPCSTRYDLGQATRIVVDDAQRTVEAVDDHAARGANASQYLSERQLLLGRVLFGTSLQLLPAATYDGVLRRTKELTASWGGRLYFVYLPSNLSVINAACDPNRTMIERIVASVGVPFIDATVGLRAEHGSSIFGRVHLTEKGYEVAARYVAEQIRQPDGEPARAP
jgi:hypothetical protein